MLSVTSHGSRIGIGVSHWLRFFSSAFLDDLTMFQRDPRAGAFLGGDRVSGQDIRDQNGKSRFIFIVSSTLTYCNRLLVIAAQSIANIVKSSLGPLGLDKMLVDNIGVCYETSEIECYVDRTVNVCLGSDYFQRWRDNPFTSVS